MKALSLLSQPDWVRISETGVISRVIGQSKSKKSWKLENNEYIMKINEGVAWVRFEPCTALALSTIIHESYRIIIKERISEIILDYVPSTGETIEDVASRLKEANERKRNRAEQKEDYPNRKATRPKPNNNNRNRGGGGVLAISETACPFLMDAIRTYPNINDPVVFSELAELSDVITAQCLPLMDCWRDQYSTRLKEVHSYWETKNLNNQFRRAVLEFAKSYRSRKNKGHFPGRLQNQLLAGAPDYFPHPLGEVWIGLGSALQYMREERKLNKRRQP